MEDGGVAIVGDRDVLRGLLGSKRGGDVGDGLLDHGRHICGFGFFVVERWLS
jgi:hypothetical protein